MSPALVAIFLALGSLPGCGDGPSGPEGTGTVLITPARWLAVQVGRPVSYAVIVHDPEGRPVSGPRLSWTSSDPSVATVSPHGVATAWGPGVTEIGARWRDAVGTALLEVYLPERPAIYEPGRPYFGRAEYVEYLPGTLPVVISAPHGGTLGPEEIPDRTYGVTATDRETESALRALRDAFVRRFQGAPHVVVSHLSRSKLDPNREVVEAAQGDPFAANAWAEYHGFIDRAKETVTAEFGWGLYLDLHGHGHPEQRLELGYLLSADDLALDDAALGAPALIAKSSVRDLADRSPAGFVELIRGETGLGGLLAGLDVRAVPSPGEPDPAGEPYFTGGYSTRRHGSRDGGPVSGIQIELNWRGIRDTPESRGAFAEAAAAALGSFLTVHAGAGWAGRPVAVR